jgi:phenylalanyl-tRNA synthetase alpha chain
MLDRIAELRQQGEAAVAGATDTVALEDVRVRFLGRKAELPNLLRGVAQLPPEERGAVGRAANEARRALDGAIEARKDVLEGAELEQRLAAFMLCTRKLDWYAVSVQGTQSRDQARAMPT